jgi:hypothetical protein
MESIYVNEYCDLERANAVVRSLAVMTTSSVTVEAGAVDSYPSFVFVGFGESLGCVGMSRL